jgi:large subunit ribosomal protein L10
MPTAEKVAKVEEVAQSLSEAKSVFLTDFTGLNVDEINELRRSFRGQAVQYRVVKNTLARLSVKSAGCEELLEYLDGPTGLAFGNEDPAAPARVIKEFSKGNDKLKLKACLFEGTLVGADRAGDLANMPTKEQLLAQVLGGFKAPISNLAYALNGVLSKLVFALDALKQQKEQE